MGETAVTNRAELHVSKQSCHRKSRKEFVDQPGIVIGATEEYASATMAGAKRESRN